MLLTQSRSDRDRAAAAPPAFTAFVAEQRTGLVRYAAVLTGSVTQAEDIVHDVLTRLFPRWAGIDDPLPYVRRAVTNDYLSWRRRWSTRNISLVDEPRLDGPAQSPRDDRPDPQMWAALMSLTRSQRTALVLRFFEGFDDDEIATVLGCRPVTVRSHVHRGLAAIRTALTDSHDEWSTL